MTKSYEYKRRGFGTLVIPYYSEQKNKGFTRMYQATDGACAHVYICGRFCARWCAFTIVLILKPCRTHSASGSSTYLPIHLPHHTRKHTQVLSVDPSSDERHFASGSSDHTGCVCVCACVCVHLSLAEDGCTPGQAEGQGLGEDGWMDGWMDEWVV